jgi:hypothetical protein
MGMLFYVLAGIMALPPFLVLALLPAARRFALQTAAGIIGSYPGVLLIQLLSLPVLLACFALFWVASLFPMNETVDNVWNLLLVLVIIAWMGLSSLTGFLFGWRVGWHLAAGVPLRSALHSSRVATRMLSFPDLRPAKGDDSESGAAP